jgi:hypothetical protein
MSKCQRQFGAYDLLKNFQGALQALVPMAEKIDVPWKNDEAYDEWEDIEACLFHSFVIYPITFDLNVRSFLPFPKYKTHIKNLAGHSFIQHQDTDGNWIFLGFRTDNIPFDLCWIEKFDKIKFEAQNIIKSIKFEELKPECIIRSI